MKILVLDTIHGGEAIARHFRAAGNEVDEVDVYRGAAGIPVSVAASRRYDLIVAPVHCDPGHPLLRNAAVPVMTHHEAVRTILGDGAPHPMVEITGKQGKTTTACALAALMPGSGVALTSRGTWLLPERRLLARQSITPASVLDAAAWARETGGWLIAEESLGVSGAGDLAVLTSGGDYGIAAGRKSAVAEKIRSLARCRQVVAAHGVPRGIEGAVYAEDVVACTGTTCTYRFEGIRGAYANPLCALPGYRIPLAAAAAAACVLGIDPAPLAGFAALPGRMAERRAAGTYVLDNANSGTNADGAIEAARYARMRTGTGDVTLVIGTEAQTICEGFPADEVSRAIREIRPAQVVLVGDIPADACRGVPCRRAGDLAEGTALAAEKAGDGIIVLAVKTWR